MIETNAPRTVTEATIGAVASTAMLERFRPSMRGDVLLSWARDAQAELDALRQDAARYRWLREWRSVEGAYPTPPWCVRVELDPWPTTKHCNGATLDTAIDEAMRSNS